MRQKLLLTVLVSFLLAYVPDDVFSQVSYADADFLNVIDYGATPDNPVDNDQDAINQCIAASMLEDKGVYFPPGDYHISGSIIVENDDLGCDQYVVITGSSLDASRRSRIILKQGSGTHTVIESMEFGLNGGECHGNSGWTDTYHRVLKHLDIKIEADNENSVGVRWRGAEGCGIYDIHLDLINEPTAIGFQNLPGSGGSTHTVSVVGGRIAMDLFRYGDFWEGSQPSPTVSGGYFEGQSEYAISGTWRGMMTLVGCHFKMENNVNVLKDLKQMSSGYGGVAGLVDCIIEYESADGENTLITPDDGKGVGFHMANVYVKNADFITNNKPAHNPDGWTYYEEVAYDHSFNITEGGTVIEQGIFIDKVLSVENDIWVKDYQNDVVPPSDLANKHRIPIPFPSFEWEGAVCINDYEGDVIDGDWSLAFNNALANAQIIIVPAGEYMVRNTIHLKPHSRILGLSHERSTLYSPGTREFDTSTDPYSDPRPILDTPDDANASCIISDIAINVGIPLNGEAQNPGAVGGYPLRWRAGRNSIIKHIDTRDKALNYFRDHYALNRSSLFKNMNLKQTDSPHTESGMSFKTYNTTGVWNTKSYASAFLLETHDGDQRIVTRPFDDVFDYQEYDLPYPKPNLTITATNGERFDLTSLKLGTADYNTSEDSIILFAYRNAQSFDTLSVLTNDQNPRPDLQKLEPGWTDIDSVVILSMRAFAVDDVVSSAGVAGFNDIEGSAVQYDARISQAMFQHLNINPEVHDKVLITGNGGGRWYNHQLHGKQWLNFNNGFLRIRDTRGKEPLHFYHLHAQHGHQRARVYMENASHVSIYGTKVEIPTSFIRIKNSDNIRCFGHGGLTNPIPGHNYYYFENTTNYLMSGLADQTYDNNRYPGDEFNELTRIAIQEGEYQSLADMTEGVLTDPGYNYKPILWRVGNPETGSDAGCSEYRTLNVNKGQKTWDYCVGEEVTIIADQLDCMEFTTWTGYTTSSEDTFSFVMPDEDITMTANYEAKEDFEVIVINGSGGGFYCEGVNLYIYADTAPEGKVFKKWTGNVENLSADTIPNPVLSVPAADVKITAEYEKAVFPQLTITNPSEGDLFQYNEAIPLEVEASTFDGSIERVEFYYMETLIGESTTEPYSFTWKFAADSVSIVEITAKAIGSNGLSSTSKIQITVNPRLSSYSGTPHEIPGRIEAEYYDRGGFNNAYWDEDITNFWDVFRTDEGVDIQETMDEEGVYNIGYMENDEYMKYTVDVESSGYYTVNLRIASATGGGKLNILMEDENVTGIVNISSTGGWQDWADKEIHEVLLEKGRQVMKLEVVQSGFNINYIDFTLDSVATTIDHKNRLKADNIRLYPNPVKDFVFIETPDYSDMLKYSIINLTGQSVMQGKIQKALHRINISAIHPGIYYMVIRDDQSHLKSGILVKQN